MLSLTLKGVGCIFVIPTSLLEETDVFHMIHSVSSHTTDLKQQLNLKGLSEGATVGQ